MKHFRFSLRSLLAFIALVAVLAACFNYRKEASKPDLSISPDDICWAADIRIWKVDLTQLGDCYGVAIVTIEEGDAKKKKRILTTGGYSYFDTSQCKVAKIALNESEDSIEIKLNCGGLGISSKIDNIFAGNTRAFAPNSPVVDGDLVYLAWDSKNNQFGSKPPGQTSNIIALEILRKPLD